MKVIKRNGNQENVQFDKITARLESLAKGLKGVEPTRIAKKVIEGLYDGVSTAQLDLLASEIAATLTSTHPDYATLASRILISNLHKNTSNSFSGTMEKLFRYVDPKTEKEAPLISKECFEIIEKNATKLDAAVKYERDFYYDYFGFKTLERSYLLRII